MKKLFSLNYIKQIGNWVWKGKFYFLSILVVIITFLYITGILSFYPNIVSLVMVITGLLILLILQILDAREFTDQRPNTPRNWIKSFPTRKTVIISADVASAVFTADRVHVKVSISTDATVEDKVDFLLKEVSNLHDKLVNIDNRIDNINSSLAIKIKDLSTDLHKFDKSLKAVIASHAVGTYDLNFFGIIITLCGTVIQFFST
jgi:hypothetical protein